MKSLLLIIYRLYVLIFTCITFFLLYLKMEKKYVHWHTVHLLLMVMLEKLCACLLNIAKTDPLTFYIQYIVILH